MLNSLRLLWKTYIFTPLSKIFAPVTHSLGKLLEPIGLTFQPYKQVADEWWAEFTMRYPKGAIWLRRFSKAAAGLYVFYFIFAIGLFGEIPTVEELRDLQTLNTSEVYTSDRVLIGKFYKENRKDIRFEDLPPHLVDALVSEEDKRFWTHSGVDLRALGRVLVYSLALGDKESGGGSTLSQQLVKNIYGRKRYWILSTPINKVREMLIARRLERAYEKKDLLSLYLNTVPFGGNVFGIEMAAKRFFNKSAKNLKLEEGAVLVGMLQQNTRFNPRRNPQLSFKRRNEVFNSMVANGKLDATKADLLKKDTIVLDYQPVLSRDAMASYFKDYLRTILPKMLEPFKKEDGTDYDIYKDGLRVYTSIDSLTQTIAEQAVTERMYELQKNFDNHWSGQKWWGDDKWLDDAMRQSERWRRMVTEGGMKEARAVDFFKNVKVPMTIFKWENGVPGEEERNMTPMDSIKYYFRQLNTGFMVTDAKTGLIKAWVGGTDFNFFQYDHCRSRRQVGSTFKPIVYAKAIQAGIRPCDYIPNKFTAYLPDGSTKSAWDLNEEERGNPQKAWAPRNADEGYMGAYSLEGALTNSVNVITANLIHRISVKAVQELATQMGVSSTMQNDMSIALGTADISLYDMMRVYGTFASRGRRPELSSVLYVTDRSGKIVADFRPNIKPQNWQPVLSPDHADMMTKMMRSVVEDGTAGRIRYKYNVTGDIAGKTGTTQNHADGWFMSYTPNLVCGAWVGGITPAVRFRDMSYGQGAYMALPIAGLFLQKLYKTPQYAALKGEKFPEMPKWIKDSMDCDPKRYSEDELYELDSMRQSEMDTLPISPTEPIPQEGQKDDHDLRAKPDDGFGEAPVKLPTTPIKPPTAPISTPPKPDVKATLPPTNQPKTTPSVPQPNKPKGQ
jgi:penicillin-binding protein 1A